VLGVNHLRYFKGILPWLTNNTPPAIAGTTSKIRGILTKNCLQKK